MLFRFCSNASVVATTALTIISLFVTGCGGGGGSESSDTVVSGNALGGNPSGSQNPPTVNLTASPSTVAFNNATTLTWTASNADNCVASDGWSGSKSRSGGNTSSGPLTIDTTFDITCSNSVGSASDSVTVSVQVGVGTASLTWMPPTTNQDGSSMDDLAGYKVYYGTSSGSYPNIVPLNNPGLSSYVVDNLIPGTYYFVVTAYDTSGNESAYSNEASKVIN
jgi:hypothetical protein